jgi:hypothetical protein
MAAPAAATPPQNAPGAGAGITGLPSSQGAPAAPAGAAAPGGYEKAFMDLFKGDTSKEDRMKEITDINAPVIEKMQSLVNEQKNKLKTEGEQDFYMALIQGGLAAAAGNSPNALQNIAQGFEKGAGRYADSLKDLRKAAQENEKMQLSLAEYEASGKKDALKSYYDHQDKMQGYKAQGLASIMHGEISAAATLGSSAMHVKASENMANAYRGPALAEQIRTHLSKELDADPRFKYNAVAKSAELERRLGLELQKYPVMGQYVPTPAGGGGAAGLRYNPQTGKIE